MSLKDNTYPIHFMYWMSFDTLHSILGYNKVLRGYVLSDIDRVKTIIEVHFQMGLDLGILRCDYSVNSLLFI